MAPNAGTKPRPPFIVSAHLPWPDRSHALPPRPVPTPTLSVGTCIFFSKIRLEIQAAVSRPPTNARPSVPTWTSRRAWCVAGWSVRAGSFPRAACRGCTTLSADTAGPAEPVVKRNAPGVGRTLCWGLRRMLISLRNLAPGLTVQQGVGRIPARPDVGESERPRSSGSLPDPAVPVPLWGLL